tara:strand:+ start:396 stop:584 length:189 start_codon:yes stop_codon:yes gene_type:complete
MKYNINIYYMDLIEFFENYLVFIILAIVIFVAIFVGASVLGLNFKRKKNQKVTKKVSFAAGI